MLPHRHHRPHLRARHPRAPGRHPHGPRRNGRSGWLLTRIRDATPARSRPSSSIGPARSSTTAPALPPASSSRSSRATASRSRCSRRARRWAPKSAHTSPRSPRCPKSPRRGSAPTAARAPKPTSTPCTPSSSPSRSSASPTSPTSSPARSKPSPSSASAGLKIGTTTGYNAEMMRVLAAEAARRGFEPDCIVTSDMVPEGRPAPWMALKAAAELGVYPMCAIVKIGDTIPDIQEGLNAGMWTIAVAATGNELGLSQPEAESLRSHRARAAPRSSLRTPPRRRRALRRRQHRRRTSRARRDRGPPRPRRTSVAQHPQASPRSLQ